MRALLRIVLSLLFLMPVALVLLALLGLEIGRTRSSRVAQQLRASLGAAGGPRSISGGGTQWIEQ